MITKQLQTTAAVLLVLLLALGAALVLKPARQQYRGYSTYLHPADYAGPVWIKLRPQPANRGKTHHYQLYWPPWLYTNEFDFTGCKEVTFLHGKGGKGKSPRIAVSLEPACAITFGQGRPIGPNVLDINAGWVKERPAPPAA